MHVHKALDTPMKTKNCLVAFAWLAALYDGWSMFAVVQLLVGCTMSVPYIVEKWRERFPLAPANLKHISEVAKES